MSRLISILASLGAVLVVVIVLTNVMRATSLFFPERYPAGFWETSGLEPRPEDVWFEASDGTRLHGWFFDAGPERPVMIWSHGNAGNITYRADAAAALAGRGVSVFVYDYRGFGRSAGRAREKEIYRDAAAALAYVLERSDAPLISYGESIGGPYASRIAVNESVCALILESSFASVRSAAAAIYAPLRVDLIVYDGLETAKDAREAAVPTLIMHSAVDSILPFALARELEQKIPDSRLVTFERSGHATLAWDERGKWLDSILGFVEAHCGEEQY